MILISLSLILGAATGASLWFLIASTPLARRPSFADRIAPHIRRPASRSTLLDDRPQGYGLGAELSARAHRLVARVQAVLGSPSALAQRLERTGRRVSVEQHRVNQLIAILLGAAVGCLLATAAAVQRGSGLGVFLGLVLGGGIAGLIVVDWRLGQQIRAREDRILAEFPTIAELLALSITAGESIASALDRIAKTSHGELAGELRVCLADVHTGMPLSQALDGLGRRIAMDPVSVFVDGLIVAVTRGSPLAEVLRAQAADVREAGRRRLMEEGGRREVAMLVPVVVFVLPVTVVFAVFPSYILLDL